MFFSAYLRTSVEPNEAETTNALVASVALQ